MTNRDRYIEDDFELEKFKNNFISKRDMRNDEKSRLWREKAKLKAASFFIMVVAIALGSLLYSVISQFIIERLY